MSIASLNVCLPPKEIKLGPNYAELFTESPLMMECGARLKPVTVAYETYGRLNTRADNAVLVCHALTGSAHASSYGGYGSPGWWEGVIGPDKALDPEKYFIVCSNFLGGCYGTTGPRSIDPATGYPFGPKFPPTTVRDMVRVQYELLQALGVKRLALVVGGSLGGMQVLEWALMVPEFIDAVCPIATSVQHSPWAIAWNEAARQAIQNDPTFANGYYEEQPGPGLSLARSVAMISYRSADSYEKKFGRMRDREGFEVESYLKYQGAKLVDRFDANTYIGITHAMDRHDITRGRGVLKQVLTRIQARVLCVGIDSDLLYPAAEQRSIADAVPGAEYREIVSLHGHDAFLIEREQLNDILSSFLGKEKHDFTSG